MPYDGGSVIGLINLLNEVVVPHKIMQPMAYSAPAMTEAKHQRHIRVGYFSFFRPHPKTGWENEKYRSIVKELIYRTISFIVTGRRGTFYLARCACRKTSDSSPDSYGG
jgi:hypothetical protein